MLTRTSTSVAVNLAAASPDTIGSSKGHAKLSERDITTLLRHGYLSGAEGQFKRADGPALTSGLARAEALRLRVLERVSDPICVTRVSCAKRTLSDATAPCAKHRKTLGIEHVTEVVCTATSTGSNNFLPQNPCLSTTAAVTSKRRRLNVKTTP